MRTGPFTEFVAIEKFEVEVSRLCFGHPVRTRNRVYRFLPGNIFAVMRHLWLPDGQQHHALAVVQALGHGAEGTIVPNVSPAVTVYAVVDQSGPAGLDGNFDQFLEFIQAVGQFGIDMSEVNPNYWRQASHRLMLRQRLSPPPGKAA